jgi:hypothetical protein
MICGGESDAMSVPAAVEVIRATPPTKRSEFATQIWRIRKQRHVATQREVVPF